MAIFSHLQKGDEAERVVVAGLHYTLHHARSFMSKDYSKTSCTCRLLYTKPEVNLTFRFTVYNMAIDLKFEQLVKLFVIPKWQILFWSRIYGVCIWLCAL